MLRTWVWTTLLCAAGPAWAQSAVPVRTTAADRESAAVTIYNSDLGLVREVRRVTLPAGEVELAFADVATGIRPETVHVKPLDGSAGFRLVEQNFRYDVLAPGPLMERYVGREVTLLDVVPGTGAVVRRTATLLSTGLEATLGTGGLGGGYGGAGGYGLGYALPYANTWDFVWRIGDEVTTHLDSRIVLPAEVPAGFVERPTLFWRLSADQAGERRLEASYLTAGMTWQADYVLVLAPGSVRGDLTGWVTVRNQSGLALHDARLKLVAGNVNRVMPDTGVRTRGARRESAGRVLLEADEAPGFVEEGLFEYHLYTLQRPTDLADREQKQIELLTATGVPVERFYRLAGQAYWFTGQVTGITEGLHPDVWLEFVNAEAVGLGVPIPAGTIRVYESGEGREAGRQFVGEGAIRHTAREERLKVRTGSAFDIVADRRQVGYRVLADNLVETEWEVRIRNRKTEAVTVQLREQTSGDWEVVRHSHPWTKESSRELRFDVACAPDREVTVTYLLRVRLY